MSTISSEEMEEAGIHSYNLKHVCHNFIKTNGSVRFSKTTRNHFARGILYDLNSKDTLEMSALLSSLRVKMHLV